MARPQAQARAYYYPTPPIVGHHIASLIGTGSLTSNSLHILDPCAGTGEFVDSILEPLTEKHHRTLWTQVKTVELDIGRHQTLIKRSWAASDRERNHVQGDTFKARIDARSFGLVLHNPPYDSGSMEEEWIKRIDQAVAMGGVHVIIIPAYVVPRIRDFLAESYEEVRIARFPDDLYPVFKQVVILARKRHTEHSEDVVQTLTFDDPLTDLPVLGRDYIKPVEIINGGSWSRITLSDIDHRLAILSHRPWTAKVKRGSVDTIPGSIATIRDPLAEVSSPRFRTLTPPPTAHISLALAAGALDGAVLQPDDPSTGLPPIAIRGKYARDWTETGRKTGSKGELYGIEEQQVPTLVISVLSLETGRIHELAQVVEPVYSKDLYQSYRGDEESWKGSSYYDENPLTTPLQLFSSGDLLLWYGKSVATTLSQRCVPVFDPSTPDDRELVKRVSSQLSVFPRRPYQAQLERIAALIKAFETLDEKRAMVPGQTGSGKTTISAQTAALWCATHPRSNGSGINRVLVTAPPHLVPEWVGNQLPQILGSTVEIFELDSITAVDKWMDDTRPVAGSGVSGVKISFGILSRSKAKAGYRVVGCDGVKRLVAKADIATGVPAVYDDHCPDCGRRIETPVEKRASKRQWCQSVVGRRPGMKDGRVHPLTSAIRELYPEAGSTGRISSGRIATNVVNGILAGSIEPTDRVQGGLTALLHALPDPPVQSLPPRRLVIMADLFKSTLTGDAREGGVADAVAGTVRSVIIDAICHDRNTDEASLIIQELQIRCNDAGVEFPTGWKIGSGPHYDGALPGSQTALQLAQERFAEETVWTERFCNTALWSADPGSGGFRRYPLAKYIHSRYRDKVSFFISDEAHEAANSDSAQSQAEQLGFKLGCPWISMTGTTGNGFPRSYHVILWHASAEYRRDFGYSDAGKLQLKFGYNKRVQEAVDDKGRVVAFGSTSAAKHRTKPVSTPAPGIVPLAVMRYITPISVPISVSDLEIDLPPCRERVIAVNPARDQFSEYSRLLNAIKAQAARDRFSERNGALMGVLAQSGTILDRNTTDVGNCETGGFEVCYAERWGRELVATSPGIPGDRILPKEQALLDYVQGELATGNRTIVGVWHVAVGSERSLSQRIATLLTDAGLKVAVLDSGKVSPKQRIAWIQKHVVKKGVDVLVCNPRAVETGINNLVYFSRIALFDGIGSSPKTYDQIRGRIHRPGQTVETEIVSFVYAGTVQELAHEHLMGKVAVVRATDGDDPRSALRSVGAEGRGSVAYSMSLAERILRMG